jgi:hypothetical protein
MTGIVACLAAAGPNAIYGTGWYNQGTSAVDTSPIEEVLQAGFGDLIGSYTWIGYLRVPTTGFYTMGISTTRFEQNTFGSSSTGQFWIGNNAIAPTGTANIITNNSSGTYAVSLTQGLYYPCRFRWNFALDYSFFFGTGAFGLAEFSVNFDTNVSGLIFYNTLTNGF